MKLIDADALLKQIAEDSRRNEGWYGDTWKFIKTIKDAPTIDAVPVVRCKDCRYWKDQAEWVVEVPVCEYDCRNGKIGIAQIMGAEDYCSHGERKTAGSE